MYYWAYYIYPPSHYYSIQQPYYFNRVCYPIPKYNQLYQLYSITRYRAIPATYPNPNSYGLWNPLGDIWSSFESAWHRMEIEWENIWKHVVGDSKLPPALPSSTRGSVIFKKYVHHWGGVTERLLQSEVKYVLKEAKEQALRAWNSLADSVKDDVATKWKELKDKAGDWADDKMGAFVYRLQELAMEAFEALKQIEDILNQLKQLKNLMKSCSSNMPLSKSLMNYKLEIPIINKTYRLNIFLCYPQSVENIIGSMFEDCVKAAQSEAEDIMWISVGRAMAASGGTGILAGVINGCGEITAKLPKFFVDCVLKKAKKTIGDREIEMHMQFA